ncbi:MAG: hypothetical protein KIT33_00990 [Candidatus Kapabacteria bacterium]|nr:hypothetical protein [Ignavibacteriota bacterium]MCW5883523.1 hypothetical protein [Candidatus Kapabacteria bacterium]
MKSLLVLLLTASIIILMSCGEKFDELKNVAEVIKNAPEAAEEMSKSIDMSEKRREERVRKGDTLALHFSELQKYLPESLDGFTSDEPNGQSTNITGFSMSTVERTYRNDETGRTIRINLMDYNESYAMFAGVAYWASLGLSTETSDGFQKTVKTDIDHVSGFEEFSKSRKNAKLSYAIGYRFMLTIEDNQADNIDYIKKIADKIDIKKLANM